jgi:hypothetical protein
MVEGSDVTTNESALTGESDDRSKGSDDPFLLSGSTLSTGYCHMLITAGRSIYLSIYLSLTFIISII